LVATTAASDITAPLESVTTPEMLPVMLAQANPRAKKKHTNPATLVRQRLFMSNLLRMEDGVTTQSDRLGVFIW
jgi:hypothetical protein